MGVDAIHPVDTADDSGTAPTPATEEEPFTNRFTVSTEQQLADPDLSEIFRRLTSIPKNKHEHNWLSANFLIKNGLLYHKDFTSTEVRHQLAVPHHHRTALMRLYHYMDHRGHESLLNQLRRSYWWDGMNSDCETFTATCAVCGARQNTGLQRIPDMPIPSPAQPFSVIHVDHKGPLPFSGKEKYTNILVVVCALTRFTLYIPVKDVTAEETLRQLVRHVFCVFGNPAAIVTDNGPAFISDLSKAAAAFLGYRHIHTLPYNPQANGVAEAAVKRIKQLLDKQTNGYRSWHKNLPLAQHMLNCTVHTGTGITPFEAVFGRKPVGLEQLENPALYPDGDGEEFLSEMKLRMLQLHSALRTASDEIKNARITDKNAREYSRLQTSKRGTVQASTATEDKFVWLLYGSRENAARIRKSGHGAPWRHKYKVLEVKPHAVRLEVPRDRSVPIVQEWQPMRRVAVARADEHDTSPDDPIPTDSGYAVRLPGADPDTGSGDLSDDDDTAYEIDHVVRAERCGTKYKIWVKWKNYAAPTWLWWSDLRRQSCNAELLQETTDAVDIERVRYNAEHGYHDDEEESESPAEEAPASLAIAPPDAAVDESLPLALRRPRRAKVAAPPVLQLLVQYLKDKLIKDISDSNHVLEVTLPIPVEMCVFGQEGIVVSP
jgi:hypothetical protein